MGVQQLGASVKAMALRRPRARVREGWTMCSLMSVLSCTSAETDLRRDETATLDCGASDCLEVARSRHGKCGGHERA
uniref:Uncharacterized protein n=1 Tax=Arundo donax TaxID=35708 RepID=A0A0A9BNN7_ARUDO